MTRGLIDWFQQVSDVRLVYLDHHALQRDVMHPPEFKSSFFEVLEGLLGDAVIPPFTAGHCVCLSGTCGTVAEYRAIESLVDDLIKHELGWLKRVFLRRIFTKQVWHIECFHVSFFSANANDAFLEPELVAFTILVDEFLVRWICFFHSISFPESGGDSYALLFVCLYYHLAEVLLLLRFVRLIVIEIWRLISRRIVLLQIVTSHFMEIS